MCVGEPLGRRWIPGCSGLVVVSVLSMENTLLYMGDGGAVKLFWRGEWPRKTRRVAGAGHAEGS